ncbi:MAG: tetratricopeptide repeat protein [Planctomycetes bacterium]|nr:tetratricopeptide repeat protein [Planctomycetota bacterium]
MGRYQLGVLRNHDYALREFTIAEQGMPGNSELIAARAFAYRQIGEWQQSLSEMKRAIALDPDSSAAWLRLGEVYARTGQLLPAREALREAARLSPESPAHALGKSDTETCSLQALRAPVSSKSG